MTGAKLMGADLSGADLTGADMTGADLTGAKLTSANLMGADLRGADLRDADLRAFKADMWMTLAENRAEIPALISAMRAGEINGYIYSGRCACLVGTIANARGVDVNTIPHDSDKPGDATGGGYAVGKALEWALEFCALFGIEIERTTP
jgi:hypothetical protein